MGQRIQQALQALYPQACLLPRVQPLKIWLAEQFLCKQRLMSNAERELWLYELIVQFPDILGDHDPWQICDNMASLFDQLNFEQHQTSKQLPIDQAPWSRETQILSTLRQAWTQQLTEQGWHDESSRYVYLLEKASKSKPEAQHHWVYFGFDHLTRSERLCLGRQLKHQNVSAYLFPLAYKQLSDTGTAPSSKTSLPNQPQRDFMALAFERSDLTLVEAAKQLQDKKSLSLQWSLMPASDQEEEARFISNTLINNLSPTQTAHIVCPNRKLARRIRALLEVANLGVYDPSGWPLSTTRAASAIMRWIECLNTDFHYLPLLDLLKSGFVNPLGDKSLGDEDLGDKDLDEQLVYRFENQLIRQQNVHANLHRYKKTLKTCASKLPGWQQDFTQLDSLIDALQAAATDLQSLINSGPNSVQSYLRAMLTSLRQLGCYARLSNDAAGAELLAGLESLSQLSKQVSHPLTWPAFCRWLTRQFEQQRFKPDLEACNIRFVDLLSAAYSGPELILFAGCNHGNLPYIVNESAPFNTQLVQRQLGLEGREQKLRLELQRFRHCLDAAQRVIFSYAEENLGRSLSISPWLAIIKTLHQLAYDDDLQCQVERKLEPITKVQKLYPTLARLYQRPSAELPLALIPKRYSAARHQRLIDCPYRFYVEDGLGLKPLDEVRERLAGSDYGNRVHRSLQAFHQQLPGYPKPFALPLDKNNRESAIAHLQTVSHYCFQLDVEDNFEHRAWLQRWLACVPAYIDWGIERQQQWQLSQCEYPGHYRLKNQHELYGRIDRVESNAQQQNSVVDYKTGASVASNKQVSSGEQVQLLSYALMVSNAVSAEYLKISDAQVKSQVVASGEELQTLSLAVAERLSDLTDRMQSETLPAWENPGCQHCSAFGLCRQPSWSLSY